jgi:hypothetical protein
MLSTCILIVFSVIDLLAGDKYTKSDVPVFPMAQPQHALAYFLKEAYASRFTSDYDLIIDDNPIGVIPQRSYMAVDLERGMKLVWGSTKRPLWFGFKAGKTYLFQFVEDQEEWFISETESELVRFLVEKQKLSYVTPTAEGLAHLQKKIVKDYNKALKKAGDSLVVNLPQTFEKVWYQAGRKGGRFSPLKKMFDLDTHDATGNLTVDHQGIVFSTENDSMNITISNIQSVAWEVESGMMGKRNWAIVIHQHNDSILVSSFKFAEKSALLKTAFTKEKKTEPIFYAIKHAVDAYTPPTAFRDRYQLTRLDSLIARQKRTNLLFEKEDFILFRADSLYKASVNFTDSLRATPDEILRLIAIWGDSTKQQTNVDTLWQNEMLFAENSTAYWIPVQESLIARLKQDVKEGEPITIFIKWIGATASGQIFLAEDFSK